MTRCIRLSVGVVTVFFFDDVVDQGCPVGVVDDGLSALDFFVGVPAGLPVGTGIVVVEPGQSVEAELVVDVVLVVRQGLVGFVGEIVGVGADGGGLSAESSCSCSRSSQGHCTAGVGGGPAGPGGPVLVWRGVSLVLGACCGVGDAAVGQPIEHRRLVGR
ncbi:hypothetical protein QR98_0084960, partial [Sarcoptes scabiei]